MSLWAWHTTLRGRAHLFDETEMRQPPIVVHAKCGRAFFSAELQPSIFNQPPEYEALNDPKCAKCVVRR